MSKIYKAIVLDDEPPARHLIQAFIERLPDIVCVASLSNAIQGLQAIQEMQPDLLFLDIQMPEMTGMELMGLQMSYRPDIVLTTAYPDYALKSYDFAVLDYLVKPIAFERFVQAVLKFRQKRQLTTHKDNGWHVIDEEEARLQQSDRFSRPNPTNASVWLREDKRLLQIPHQDILYVEGLKDYVKVFLKDQMILTHMNLGKAEKIFLPPEFVRIHRSYLVRQAAIRLIDGSNVVLTNGKELHLGAHYREELKKYIPILQ